MVMSHGGSAVHLRSRPTRRASGPIRSASRIRSESSHDTLRRICPSPSPGLDTPRRICPSPGLDTPRRICPSPGLDTPRRICPSPSPGLDTPRRICPSPSPPLGDLGLRSGSACPGGGLLLYCVFETSSDRPALVYF